MIVLITGAGGQLGSDLVRVLSGMHEVIAADRHRMDVTDARRVREMTVRERPNAIVHAAAYTNVDGAERDPAAAYAVNAVGAANVAAAGQAVGAKVVYVSSDYVFDGRQLVPYRESDVPLPINAYGKSKLRGERFTRRLCDRSFVVRTSWLYGSGGNNFVGKVVARARRDGRVPLVIDQFGSPTYTLDLADWIGRLIETDKYGVYHAVNRGWCSRYEFGEAILDSLGMENVRKDPVTASGFPLPACRPAFSALDDEAARTAGLIRMRGWREALEHYLRHDFESG